MNLMNSEDAITWSIDMNNNLLYISDEYKRWLGYSYEDSFKRSNVLQEMVYAEDVHKFNDHMSRLLSGQTSSLEYRILIQSNEIRWVQNVGIPVQGMNNDIISVTGVILDITKRKVGEESLYRSEQRYKSLFIYNSDVVYELDLNGCVVEVNPAAAPILEEQISVAEGDITLKDMFESKHDELISDCFEKTLEGQSPQYSLTSRHKNGEVAHWAMKNIPIYVNRRVVGVYVNAKDVTVNRRIQKKFSESEDRFRRMKEMSPQPIISHRMGEIIAINPAGLNLLGATHSKELIGESIDNLFHANSRRENRIYERYFIDNEWNRYEQYKLRRLDGRYIEVKTTRVYDNITETTLLLIEDITERLRVERELLESEERYRRLVELSPVAIAVYRDEKITYINPAGAKMLGVEVNRNVSEKNIMDWIHEDYREYARERMEYTILNGYCLPTEYQLVRSDGNVIFVSVLSIYDTQSSSLHLMFEDITEKKQVESALIESEELNRQIFRLSPEAIVLHKDFKFISLNLAALKLFGVSNANELTGQSIFDWVHPEYIELVMKRWGGEYESDKDSAHIEQRIIQRDGKIIDVEVIASSILYRGEFVGISIFRDISDRKRVEKDRQRTEQIIRESEERYFHLQTSLDQFSHDLFAVMKVSQLEQRLLQEVQEILGVTNVRLVKVNHHEYNEHNLCEIIESELGYSLKVGVIAGRDYLLYIDEKPESLKITSIRVWLETIARYVSVLLDNFLSIENITNELKQTTSEQIAPTWLLRFMFNLSENERKHLAQDLHDSALQEQIIWYRKLDLLLLDKRITGEFQQQLKQISEGLLDVIYQIRITCNELRPPMLSRNGITSSLEGLFDFTQLRSNYSINFNATHFMHTLSESQLIGVYRIVQELLANASKHSSATEVRILLSSVGDHIALKYEDNGVGMDLTKVNFSYSRMGIYGMRERVRSMDGTIEFRPSEHNGLAISISIPAS
ncbi:PAS domain S-box protein [Paenibacillus crassostreae]|uniref:histidine kinase n=1 Tax=Paenibacillus crassostreae TaxID=1763538 RepID=A0A167BA95_9BACL|nr:PAS domain S-box protein [Paenibacillus crassostreae]AOZ93031.1 hypothetical protein LPB68_12945 [Paenibacillus crassostreae]OAB71881.1 hypothetical protein PNBC_17945 [Paenibacillus crassostreae]